MNVIVKYLERTCFDKDCFIKFVKKYVKSEKDLLIVFDKKIADFGYYTYDEEKKINIIKIAMKRNKKSIDGKKVDNGDEKYNMISTLLHEFKHLEQHELLGHTFWDKKGFSLNEKLKDEAMATEYSRCELEAKAFENKNVLKAVEFYDCFVKEKQIENGEENENRK